MRLTRGKQVALGVTSIATAGLLTATMLGANGAPVAQAEPSNTTQADLVQLNNSGVSGTADVLVDGRQIDVQVAARKLLKKQPHAQHIHFGKAARHECPTVKDDDNADHRLTTSEGQPAYGPVRVSLTTKGDTSPKSTLAVNRYPTAPKGKVNYQRDDIKVSKRVARAIRHGNAVVVLHGIDYNGNGKYDFSAGRSDLDPSLPAEATDTAACGVLEPVQANEEDPGLPPIPLKVGGKQGGHEAHSHQH